MSLVLLCALRAIDRIVKTSASLVDLKGGSFVIFKTFHVLYHHLEAHLWCSV